MRPDAHFRQHHDLEAPRVDHDHFQPAWRVLTRLEVLRDQGAISLAEWLVTIVYRHNWSIAHRGAWPAARGLADAPSRRVTDHYTVARLDALRALRAVREHISSADCDLVDACVIDDRSWSEIGRRLGVDHKTARIRVIAAIKGLTAIPRSAYR